MTGSAGFIGFHAVKRLLGRGDDVVGLDVINDYYDPQLKLDRLAVLERFAAAGGHSYRFVRSDIANSAEVNSCFAAGDFDRVIHLAAQAGVRHSIEKPMDYVLSNLVGFTNVLEACRHYGRPHLTFASTSSVYGANEGMPFAEHHTADHPLQFYAATKRANELMAHSYSHLFGVPTTGLRFFTVYGPWGRPDMALFKFTKSILAGEPIELYNFGRHTRDFTYVEDIVEGVIRASDDVALPNDEWSPTEPSPESSSAPYRIFNIGCSAPVPLAEFVDAIEASLERKAIRKYLPLQAGDVPDTYADVSRLASRLGYRPSTSVRDGVRAFVEWYRDYYKV